MEELNKEYTLLFNGITDAIQQLETISGRLKSLQLRAEETYLREAEGGRRPSSAPSQHSAGEGEN